MRKPIHCIFLLLILGTTLSTQAKFSKISRIELRPIFHRQFRQPVFAAPYPAPLANCPEPYAIVEKPGTIRLESLIQKCNAILLDHREKVSDATLEEGLLGLAFPKDFAQKGRYYIYYSAARPRRTILSRITVKNPRKPDTWEEEELITIRQPFSNHNGGMLEFGPDGYLYIGVGDGGSGGDPRGNGQNLLTHLGKILRIDVSTPTRYRIPADNPFARTTDGEQAKPEIFAYGLRNPWRFSFTPEGRLIVADVGQNDYEELSFADKGNNLGWNIMEGMHCFKPKTNCPRKGLVLPFFEYDHTVGQSILGGYVYDGTALAEYRGKYIFGDSISGRIFAIDYKLSQPQAELLIQAPGLWSSFGRLRDGELVIAELQSGKIFQLVPSARVGERP
ncbi:MAG: PQQ-dependent sugar dehydrogenase [Turneriella sp.]|nr:PQQ-dependent sugar dehydrogenase [Turneriella sp.]